MPAATPRGGAAATNTPSGSSGSSTLPSSVLDGMYTGGLPAEVTAAVQSALPTSDPLDRPDFDAVEYINAKFASAAGSEQALDEALDPFIAQVTAEIGALDADISEAIEAQAKAGEQATKDISEAQAAIADLLGRIEGITKRAEQSEAMVQEICRDIRQLDCAKRHLQTTITALKRLHMLVSAVEQLSFMAQGHHYKEAANLVDAVRQLATHFEAYESVPKIKELRATVDATNKQLHEQITKAFAEISELTYNTAAPGQLRREDAPSGSFKSLAEACMVVDALGPEARKVHIDDFCQRQLGPYAIAFPKGGEFSGLEHVERRFAWFRRTLKAVDERFEGVFPAHWRVPHCLLMAFLQQTRQHILETLEAGGPEVEKVEVLLRALQKALLFEREMQPRFESAQIPSASAAAPSSRAPGAPPSPFQKKEEQQQGQQAGGGGSQFASLAKDGKGVDDGKKIAPSAADVLPVLGLVSGVFDPFMGPYVELEKRNMEEMLQKAIEEDQVDRNQGLAKLPVFTSAINIFVYIKNAIKRCTALTTAATFFTLAKEFKACLQKYAKLLRGRLPGAAAAAALAAAGVGVGGTALPPSSTAGGSGKPAPLAEGGEVDVCYLINTAEYCADTVPQLEEMVRAKIDAAYAESVKFAPEVDAFDEAISAAVKVLVSGLEAKFEAGWKQLAAFNWAACEGVGEESPYVRTINDAVRAYVPSVRALLSQVYFRNFCDKFAQSFLPTYLHALLRLKRINEMGTQQLLLDIYNLKTLTLHVPTIGLAPGEGNAPPTYTKYVTKQFAKMEVVLKLVGTPVEMLAERFKIMWPDGEAQDIQSIMQLKGMTRKEQQAVLAAVGLEVASAAGGDEGAGAMGTTGGLGGKAHGHGHGYSPSATASAASLAQGLAGVNLTSLNAATAVAGKGMKSVADELVRKAWQR